MIFMGTKEFNELFDIEDLKGMIRKCFIYEAST